jgi:hypothetical protein
LAGSVLALPNDMKTFFKNDLQVSTPKLGILIGLIGVLSVLFNNCSQNGEVALNPGLFDNPPADIQVDPDSGPSGDSLRFKKITSNFEVGSGPNNKVDILIVMDNSLSMSQEQQKMAERFSGFIQSLEGLDWQLGITTTDMASGKSYSDGRLINLYKRSFILDSKIDVDFAAEIFSEKIQRDHDRGSGQEQGIKAIFRAIERTDLHEKLDTTHNRLLFRKGASLAIIIVSDADETGPRGELSDYNQPEKLLSYLGTKWPQKVVTVHSIIVKSDDRDCLNYPKSINEAYGKAYEFLSRETLGIVGSVCEPDYSGQLKIMGQDITDKVNSIKLACAPVDASNDGLVDFSLKDTQGTQVEDYLLMTNLVHLPESLPPGKYELDYTCRD